MLKKISVLALAGMLCLPSLASAGGGAADLGRQIDDLQRQLEQLKMERRRSLQTIAFATRPTNTSTGTMNFPIRLKMAKGDLQIQRLRLQSAP